MNQRSILFKGIGVLVGLVFVIFGVRERLEYSRTRSRGLRAVVDPVTEFQQFGNRGSPTYTAEFSFKTPDGQQVKTKHSFSADVLDAFKAGRPVEIIFEPSNPTVFVFANESAPWTLVLIGVGLAGAAVLFA